MKILNQRTRGVWLLLFAFALCPQAFAETVTNTYDTLNRLTSVVYGNGQQITYTYDAAGNRTAMSGNTLPGVPASVTATAGNGSAGISFTAPANNGGSAITGYTVTSVPAGGVDTNAGTTTLIHTIAGLTNGTAYTFIVTATNSVGTGAASASSNSVMPSKPDQTIGIISFTPATLNVGGTTTASATATSSLAVSFGSSTPTVCTVSGSTVTGVAVGTCTIAAGQAGDANYNAAIQITQNITVSSTIPSAPTIGTATAGNAQATVSFTAPANNGGSAITGYTVTSNPAGGVDTNAGTTSLTHTITGLTNGTVYTFTVTAHNGVGDSIPSSPSNSVTLVAAPDTQVPTVPTNATTNPISTTQINLSWTASTDNVGVTAYKVYRDGVLAGTSVPTSFSDTGLTATTGYIYTVSACDAAGNCSAQSSPVLSNTLSVADTLPPSVPASLAATPMSSSRISLHWAVSTDNVAVSGYQVYRDGVQVGTPVGATYIDNGLKALTSYRYTVSACDSSSNCSAQSVAILAKTLTGSLAAGNYHSTAIKSDGSLWSWGLNLVGQLGDNSAVSSHKPNPVGADYVSVATGGSHTVALKSDSSLWAWGLNSTGQLGDNTTTDSLIPKQIGTDYTAITAGNGHTVGLKSDGSVWAWGLNSTGQLGDNTIIDSLIPKQIGTDYMAITAGNGHTVGLKSDGSVWAWGLNSTGQLGDNTIIDSLIPKQIDIDYIAIAAGNGHTVGLKSDGSVWAWGANLYGQLGDNTTTDSLVPKLIDTGFIAIAAGQHHTVALKADGSLWAWGNNSNGQLGDNSTVNSLIPKQVGTGFDSIAAGLGHNLATKPDGSLWTWGFNIYGQLGDNTTTESHVPKKIGTTSVPVGDLTGNGVVDVADALKGLRIAAGLNKATPADLLLADVAPLVNGKPQPDGQINIGDVVVLLRRALGLVTW